MRRREFRRVRAAVFAAVTLTVIISAALNRDDVVQAQRLATVTVSVRSDGTERQISTAQATVAGVLRQAQVEVGPYDLVTPALSVHPSSGMRIRVIRVSSAVETVSRPIPFDTVKRFSKSLRPGAVKELKAGVQGEKTTRYMVRYLDGDPVKRTVLSSQVTVKPVDRIVTIGYKGWYASRGDFRTKKILSMRATAYDPGPRSCGKWSGRTGGGLRAGYGVVAVDPRVIPLGTKLYVEGYGYAIAGDTGGAIKGNRIDLCFATYREAIRYGCRRVKVHVLAQ